ncbi:uncharacterized protein LOC113377640 [Ctenocephalides felis]|uniref:uncharacterized protein LOC113377640 n=1 Tax=Ctenocephalides felis TaxID=7515 RepID=UPI000E6E4ED0|nr:uncharacterized protein LOC113377640 [Ctenocephalides felis]
MPAATTPPAQAVSEKPDKSEEIWNALKRHIMRERQRKKQEQEAEVEEERLRKEREARERQDVMTLGETREQILLLEKKLSQLKDEKHLLFLRLKKVLNEDDNRRRQLIKENSEQMMMHSMPPQPMVHQQIFLPPVGASANARPIGQPHILGQPQQLLHKAPTQIIGGGAIKRGRSPSPTPNVGGYYKTTNYIPPKVDEGRRGGEVARAVLWNKPSQYTNPPGTPFYQVAPPMSTDNRPTQMIYSTYAPKLQVISHRPEPNIRQAQNYHIDLKQEPGKASTSVYHINVDPKPTISDQNMHMSLSMPEKMITDRNYHIDLKHDERKMQQQERTGYIDKNLAPHGLAVAPPQQSQETIVYSRPMHGGGMPITNSPQNQKTGSITSGYPIRPPNAQQNPPMLYPRHRY